MDNSVKETNITETNNNIIEDPNNFKGFTPIVADDIEDLETVYFDNQEKKEETNQINVNDSVDFKIDDIDEKLEASNKDITSLIKKIEYKVYSSSNNEYIYSSDDVEQYQEKDSIEIEGFIKENIKKCGIRIKSRCRFFDDSRIQALRKQLLKLALFTFAFSFSFNLFGVSAATAHKNRQFKRVRVFPLDGETGRVYNAVKQK